ncbi:branched-chain amino acid ABC transporter permease/ATP-binding protein [Nocardioides sp. Root190]|uniref:branched-chain amino acid ABC transporter permease/ATP-binding protein n=1 Tax=Nocardioides sp. Root190 TaxID=1736488 RepID=UPI0006F5EE62|nr:branched-chain amino acid ABC transporter permease/ATP-binding protein [Nocardioides sp. Root190]KRB80416.1 branched-chain amino acid ABC transporter permease/ATP-binding protein [Nocardioides sp. Root190]
MGELVPFVIAGLVTGSIYGLAAVGLVLTYKTSGIFNFAHGAMATVSAYGFYTLYVDQGLPWFWSALVCVLIIGPLMGLVLEALTRMVARATLELQIAATIGVLLLVQGGVTLVYGQIEVRTVPVFLSDSTFTIGDTVVQWSDAITFLVAVVVTVLLSLGLTLLRRGVAMRAVVDDPDLLDLTGTSAAATRRLAWSVGAGLASLSGVLFAPLLPLDPLQLTLLVVQAFGAAAIGRFTSLPATFVGGLVIGVAASLATREFTEGLWAGIPAAMPFLALFLVLLLMPRRFLATRERPAARTRPSWRAPGSLQIVFGLGVVGFLTTVPSFADIHLTDWTVALAMTIVFLSLGLLVRTSGQASLCHVGFTAIGASAFARLTVDQGLPWFLALLVAGLVAVPIGAVLAIPAIRLSPLYLALATFGFGIVLQVMFYTQDFMFGDTGAGLTVPRPSVFGAEEDAGYYRLVLVITVAVALLVVALNRGRMGRLLRGVAESPTALTTAGVSLEVTRVLVFCLSAFLAAVGGALAGAASTNVSADSYQPLLSITWFALIVIVVGHEPWYALLAAGVMILLPSYSGDPEIAFRMQVAFGVLAIVVAALTGKLQVPRVVRDLLDRLVWKRRGVDGVAVEREPVTPMALEADALTVRYGGVVAVDGLTLTAPTGRITGLIGPNGAGKTTTFNACSGLVRASSGRIRVADHTATRWSVARRARHGLGRTFQRMELFDSLSVRQNVAIGAEGVLAGGNPLRQLFAFPGENRKVATATRSALELCGIADLADRTAGSLSTGQRRLVELARCLAGPSSVLLLDEPSSGLDHTESRRFGEILKTVVRERGVGILIVEHDMALVLDVCDHIHVLDFGKPLFEGTPDEVRSSDLVQAAYLGSPDVETATAGA